MEAALADMQACFDRDPACDKYTQCLLYFKGFQAIQCHRIAHHLWGKGRKVSMAAYIIWLAVDVKIDRTPPDACRTGAAVPAAAGVVRV